ncbi:hypothetical protein K437DRAFT_3171 [Tilletiaria anomala UBC 951]|uniref:Anti-proliferative protein domain-containing protein n=1 Tax=Tilletiaria anomala (strain ATCC 24038 / CBS 436.72 / UBC 951) TaxID=1037660 RepID=A0A066WHV2_TILAU|nr:uncharacterized protein K437DRAFT_3171 [Tilletiaria anomala UBC 951]KDN53597.1 hypothetical protein K437DRAFT_3171 [Tilletiaria anomala UBC 951]
MLEEIAAATAYIAALAQDTSSSFAWTQAASDAFRSTLATSLTRRYLNIWHPEEPDRGSAARALFWHADGSSDGSDEAIQQACRAAVTAAQSPISALQQLLPTAFIIWVDPGCVSMRKDCKSAVPFAASNGEFKVIWGNLPSKAIRSTPAPVKLCSSDDRNLTMLRSHERPSSLCTASAARTRTNTSSSSNHSHSPADLMTPRSLSNGSSCVSSPFSEPLSAYTTSSLSSYSGSSDDEDAASSLCGFSDISADDDELVECANSLGLLNFMSDDSMDQAGDVTVTPANPQQLAISSVLATANGAFKATLAPPGYVAVMTRAASAPLPQGTKKETVQIYDKGNVSVVSGGVKLGMAKPITKQPSLSNISGQRNSHGGKASLSMQQGWTLPQSSPKYPALPLPYGMRPAMQDGTASFYKAAAAAFGSGESLAGEQAVGSFTDWSTIQQQLEEQQGDKKARARGRRSRGRGAGRALRRQRAAALRALTEAEAEVQNPMNAAALMYNITAGASSSGSGTSSGSLVSNASQGSLSGSNYGACAAPAYMQPGFQAHLENLARQHLQRQAQNHPGPHQTLHLAPVQSTNKHPFNLHPIQQHHQSPASFASISLPIKYPVTFNEDQHQCHQRQDSGNILPFVTPALAKINGVFPSYLHQQQQAPHLLPLQQHMLQYQYQQHQHRHQHQHQHQYPHQHPHHARTWLQSQNQPPHLGAVPSFA